MLHLNSTTYSSTGKYLRYILFCCLLPPLLFPYLSTSFVASFQFPSVSLGFFLIFFLSFPYCSLSLSLRSFLRDNTSVMIVGFFSGSVRGVMSKFNVLNFFPIFCLGLYFLFFYFLPRPQLSIVPSELRLRDHQPVKTKVRSLDMPLSFMPRVLWSCACVVRQIAASNNTTSIHHCRQQGL